MLRMPELIHNPNLLNLIPTLTKNLDISREGSRIAANINYSGWIHFNNSIKQHAVTALAWWIYNHNVRVAAILCITCKLSIIK